MQYLFVASGSLTLFIMALILGKRGKVLSDHILVVWLAVFAINLSSFLVLYQATPPFNDWQQLILEFSEVSIFIHGPLLWWYTRSLTSEQMSLSWADGYHLIPFVFGYVFFLIHIFLGKQVNATARDIIVVLKMGSLLIYLVLALRRLRQHRSRVEHLFSNVEKKYLNWLTFLIWGVLIIWVIAGVSLLVDRVTMIDIPQYGGVLVHIAMCLFIFFMGYFGLNQPSIFVNPSLNPTSPKPDIALRKNVETTDYSKYSRSGLDPEQSRQIQDDLNEMMENQKPYLEQEINLYALAERLKVQPNHLSQVINSLEGQNFFNYINSYRVAAAKEKILSEDFRKLTLLGIAFDCGFNSKASFNRAFKKFTGSTPSEFKSIQRER